MGAPAVPTVLDTRHLGVDGPEVVLAAATLEVALTEVVILDQRQLLRLELTAVMVKVVLVAVLEVRALHLVVMQLLAQMAVGVVEALEAQRPPRVKLLQVSRAVRLVMPAIGYRLLTVRVVVLVEVVEVLVRSLAALLQLELVAVEATTVAVLAVLEDFGALAQRLLGVRAAEL